MNVFLYETTRPCSSSLLDHCSSCIYFIMMLKWSASKIDTFANKFGAKINVIGSRKGF